MLGWSRGGKVRRLQKAYERKLVEARDVQRNGDVVRFSELIAESERILDQIEEIERAKAEGSPAPPVRP